MNLRRHITPARTILVAALAATAALAAGPVVPAAAARTAQSPDPANLGARPVRINDTVLDTSGRRARARAAQSQGSGGATRADNGELVRIFLSPRYTPNPSVNRAWANFFTRLIHGPELQRLEVYIAPYREVQEVCGPGADACYSPVDEQMVIPGETPPDNVPLEEIAAHEYGHHLATNRSNYPWPAVDWGTKRWATNQRVCNRVQRGEIFPGDEGRRYRLNPGEAFADAYRVLNGGTWSGLFDASFRPTPLDLALIREDVLNPWRANSTEVRSGTFTKRGRSVVKFSLSTPLDGRLKVTLKGSRRSDIDLYLYDASRRRLARSVGRGASEGLRGDLCGVRTITVAVRRYKGVGSFRLKVSKA